LEKQGVRFTGTTILDRNEGTVFDPEMIELMRSALDDAWSSLLPEQQASVSRTLLAERILRAATQGERDPAQLRARALFNVVRPNVKAS
jgi:hypothetical protein